ncbi:MAG: tRNA (guanosine(46)-N7)-methyltransferase TrmB [Bacteroidetes bacterium]|nr:tRNA (guanosine(46)-N7)-methyltransferase TrmB [Bacteroidota bacterium]
MPKNKLQRFAELRTFANVHEFLFNERENNFKLKGKWNKEYFKNNNPIVLELGCGKGEYSIGLAERYPNKNFIGVDIKGARIWRGSKNAQEKNLKNVSFLRTQVEFIEGCFEKDEVSEIWITFPDPQPNKEKKRLTHLIFLNRYKNILQQGGIIHLKTDSLELHEFTLEVIAENKFTKIYSTADLYSESNFGENWAEATELKTHYEKLFTDKGKKITYLKFQL